MSLPAASAVRTVTDTLGRTGVATPLGDAELLVAAAAGVSRGQLVLARLDAAAAARLDGLAQRRAAREPLQHILGSAGFRHLDLAVGPGVFVPRPETEQVVEVALARLRTLGVTAPVVVDLCTGSGAIALAIAQEHPSAQVTAVEADAGALAWAERNVGATGLPVRLVRATASEALPELDGRVDLVVSNPPYLTAGLQLEPEVGLHDPDVALWGGGADGLDVVREVEAAAWRLLRPGGVLVVEHGDDQGETAPAVFRARWSGVEAGEDLAGRPRWVTAVRRDEAVVMTAIQP